jgi:hypothetical protein
MGVETEQPNDRPQVFHRQPGQEMAAGTDEEIRVAESTRLLVFETTPRKYCVKKPWDLRSAAFSHCTVSTVSANLISFNRVSEPLCRGSASKGC